MYDYRMIKSLFWKAKPELKIKS